MFSINGDLVRNPIPRLPFEKIAAAILGSSYELSLVFVGDARMRTLNHTHRGKDRPTNILSFAYDTRNGEIIIDCAQARREARAQKRNYPHYLGYLFIHGCLHLKGYTHGHIMEDKETRYLRHFNLE